MRDVQRRSSSLGSAGNASSSGAPGKRALTDGLIQRRGSGPVETADPHAVAAEGVAGGGSSLPHLDRIQTSFGHHDVGGIQAHVGGAAADAAGALGAEAYATGSSVAFARAPDLHTAAHEAAHVIQQQAGVQLLGGMGEEGDAYERHADAVADAVVRGESAQGLLDATPGGGGGRAVQRKIGRPTREGGGEAAAPAEAPAEGAPAEAEGEAKPGAVAYLRLFIDVDVKSLGLKDLMEGRVGHTWIALEYKDPHAVPAGVHAAHRPLLQAPGRFADPMGFWPDIRNNVFYSPNLFKSWVQGWMNHPDREHEGNEKAVQTWELTQAEVDAVIHYAESKRGAQYSVYFFNCTTFAKEAVEAAGKSAPSMSTMGICFPNAAYDGIKKNQAKGQGNTEVMDLDTGATTQVAGADATSKKSQS